MSVQKTKEEIVEETIQMVKNHGRAIHETENTIGGQTVIDRDCMYRVEGKDHPGCAVGRCLIPSKYQESFEFENPSELAEIAGEGDLDDLLIPEYRGHSVKFWQLLQRLHDNNPNWKDGGKQLTEEGKKLKCKILNKQYED